MPKSRGRKPKKPKRPVRRVQNAAPPPPSAGRFTTAGEGVTWKRAMSALGNPNLPPDALVVMLVPMLWSGIMAGRQANVCVDACRTLQHAYGQFGLRSELRAVEFDVVDAEGRVVHHAPQPSWEGNVLDGHCIVYLPDDGRFVDATTDQYRHVADLQFGVVVGRVAQWGGGSAQQRAAIGNGRLPAGAQMVMQRQGLTLHYLVANDAATGVILDHPSVRDNVEAHRRAGINLASLSLDGLRSGQRVRAAPYPRLHALLDAIGQTPVEVDEGGDCYFKLVGEDGIVRRLRLDEIPLPETTPPPIGEGGPIAQSRPASAS